MSDQQEFLGGTSQNLGLEYEERKKYLQYFREKGYPLLDTLYDKKLYGLIDNDARVVIPTVVTKAFGEPSTDISGLTYVVDIFEQFKRRYLSSSSFKVPSKIRELKQ